MLRRWFWVLGIGLLGACDSDGAAEIETDSAATSSENTDDEVTDLRVPIPEPDPKYVDLIGPERIVQPGEDAMYCTHLTNDSDDLAVHYLDVMQGKFGHHVVLLATTDPKPAGTTEDCSDDAYMENVSAYVLPGTELPDGYAVHIPANTSYIMQSHYVNASLKPIRVRDVARMETLKPDEVKGWAATMTTNIRNFDIPADGTEHVLSFDCIADQDMTVHLAGPHMHEWGTRFEFSVGPDTDNLSSVVYVDPWKPEYRDLPPISLFQSNPLIIPKGSILRTTCVYANTTGKTIEFPEEMCSAFAYIVGTKQRFMCDMVK